jgi:hypothetical protein
VSEIHPDDVNELVAEGLRDPSVDRRSFLRLGATGAVAVAVLAACSDDESAPPSETGVTEPEPTETTFAPPPTTSEEQGQTNDALVFRTARTVELAMIEVYGVLLGGTSDLFPDDEGNRSGLAEDVAYDADTESTLELLRDRHRAHADALETLIRQAGGEPADEPNNGIIEGVVAPQIPDLTTQRTVLLLARSLEDVAAGTYGWGAGSLTTAELREGLMAIGAVTARHGAAISLLLDPSGADAARAPVLDTSGPARLPDHMQVTADMDGGDALAEPAPAGGEEDPGASGEGEESPEEESDSGSDAGAPEGEP